MSDDNNLTAEQLKEQLDSIKAEKDKALSDLEGLKADAKKAFEKRDELKKQLEEAEKAKLEGSNQFKELYEKEQSKAVELEQKQSDLMKQVSELDGYKTKWTTYETSKRADLLSKVKDEDLKPIYEKMELIDLEKLITKQVPAVSSDGSRSGGVFNYDGKKWDDIPMKDRDTLAKDNPELYKKIYYERYHRYPQS